MLKFLKSLNAQEPTLKRFRKLLEKVLYVLGFICVCLAATFLGKNDYAQPIPFVQMGLALSITFSMVTLLLFLLCFVYVVLCRVEAAKPGALRWGLARIAHFKNALRGLSLVFAVVVAEFALLFSGVLPAESKGDIGLAAIGVATTGVIWAIRVVAKNKTRLEMS